MRALRVWLVIVTGGQLVLASGQTFSRRYDPFGQHYEQVAWDVEPNGEDGYAVTTFTYYDDSVYLYITAALLRLDAEGQVLTESKMLYGMSSVYAGWANCAVRANDGGIAIGGATYPPSEIPRAAIVRYAANGDSLWLREFGEVTQESVGRQVKQSKDGGYILCGEINMGGSNDALLLKTDVSGNEEWHRSYGGPGLPDGAICVDTTLDDGYYVGGQFRTSQNNKDLWVFRVDGNGDSIWSKRWGTPYDETYAYLTTLASGNALVAGATGFTQDNAQGRFYMAELGQDDGHFIWQRYYGAVNIGGLVSVKEVGPGGGAIAGGVYFEPDSTPYFKGSLLRTAADGDSLWMRNYFYYDSLISDGYGYFRDVLPTADGGFIACGVTHGCYACDYPPGYEQDAWVVKVDSMGCLVPGCDGIGTGITTQITNLREVLAVYPNPVHDEVSVRLTLPGALRTRCTVMSIVASDGRVVRNIPWPSGGSVTRVVDIHDLSPGLYTLHVTDGPTWITGARLIVE